MRAWVDESARRAGAKEPMYLLGASITREEQESTIVDELRARAPRGKKLHWRDLGDRGRREMETLLARLELLHFIVIAAPLGDGKREERARGRCVERLLWELTCTGVDAVTFESRSRAQDVADRRRIDGLRSQHAIGPDLFVEWEPGASQPLLWLPDLLLGAEGEAVDSDASSSLLGRRVTRIRIAL